MSSSKSRDEIQQDIFKGWDESQLEKGKGVPTVEEKEKQYEDRYETYTKYVPVRYRKAKYEDINQQDILDSLPLYTHGKNGLYLWGGIGVGKTHMLYAIKDYYALNMKDIRVVNVTEMLSKIKSSFNTREPWDVVDDYASEYQGFDDIGVEKDSEWVGEQIYRLVNYKYEERKPFIFTSNLSLAELAGRFGGIQGDRIASRIAEMANVIELKGNDRRV